MTPRLKSLELHGYKTFASRILFEFPGDITAVVGPNGSGKSNIADSLRWVLGEQAYSLLRGRKTEDMIFSGSEMRPRASMASATITFLNEDAWLPIDFSEVSITRRAYRDGQNEYLLNGQRVRLKEIAELLGRSGLAERTYTIIGQGLVDAALSLKPEERRRFFEEAAGIGLYRSRREEALARLDTTRRNLERVLDILSELEPRLASLEKQARRAQEYERIRADLRILLRDWYGYHWHRNQQEVVHCLEAFHAQESRLERSRERQVEVEVHQNEIRKRLTDLRESLNNWHATSSVLHGQWEKVSRNLAVMDERKRAIQNQQQALQSEIARLEEEHRARQEHLVDLVEERDRLQADRVDADEQVTQARKKLEQRQAERVRIEQILRDARRSLVEAETAQVQLKAHKNELSQRIDSLRKNQEALAKTHENETQLLQQLQARLEKQVQMRQRAEQVQKEVDDELLDLRKEENELEHRQKETQDEHNRHDAERARMAVELEVLEQAERSLSGVANGAKYLLQEARQGRLNGKLRPLGAQLVVPAEYEAAISASLGDYLDGVLLDKEGDLESVLVALSSVNKGRAVIIPEDLSDRSPVMEIPSSDGFIGRASDLVQVPENMQNLFHMLLGQVFIVQDRIAARQMIAEIPLAARVVTLHGEVFYPTGVIIAGSDVHSTTIGRPRRIQELHSALSVAESRLKQSQAQLQQIQDEQNRLREMISELDSRRKDASQELNKANQAHQRAVLEVEQVRQRCEFQSRQLSTLNDQIKRSDLEVRQGQAEMEAQGKKIASLNDKVRELNKTLSGIPLDELQSQVVHWNTAVAVASRALQDAERRLAEHRVSTSAGLRQMETIKLRLGEAINESHHLETEKDTLYNQESDLNAQIEKLRAKIEPAEEQLQDVERDYDALQSVLSVAQQAVTVAERHTTQAQLELTRVREALETLRRRIEDDFGLVAFENAPELASQTPLPFDGMVEQLPVLTELPVEVDENISRQRALLRRMGPINFEVESEYRSVKERYEFLNNQVADLRKADADLGEVISDLDELMRREFRKTFDAVATEFKQLFTRLFGGGSARLILVDADNPIESGIDIEARLPGRREQGLSLLSGGERSLTAVALIFSLLKVSPTPFCVMDEVDAMLDEANVGRFRELLTELSDRTQFIVVTHNRNTVQAANVIYGVTMGRDSVSQVISLKLDEISEEMVR